MRKATKQGGSEQVWRKFEEDASQAELVVYKTGGLNRFLPDEEKRDVSWLERSKKPNHELAVLTNVIKATLIDAYCPKLADRVLDIGCGRGSDSKKFERMGVIHYIGTDLTKSQVEEGAEREQRQSSRPCAKRHSIKTYLHNISHELLDDETIQRLAPFDMITSFLSLQYLFASENATKRCIGLLSSFLKPREFFLCILPDGDAIQQRFEGCNTFGNEDYGLYEHCPSIKRSPEPSSSQATLFPSIPYLFSLKGSFSKLPESCLPSEAFIS